MTHPSKISDALSYLLQYPSVSVVRLKNFSDICTVEPLKSLALHIVKVFFASPLLKMWKFS